MDHAAMTGVLHGNTIVLDAPVPALEGRRVRVIIVPEGGELILSADEQARRWDGWVMRGQQGPLEEEGEPELP